MNERSDPVAHRGRARTFSAATRVRCTAGARASVTVPDGGWPLIMETVRRVRTPRRVAIVAPHAIVQPSRMHLTRRGRAVVAGVIAAVLIVAFWLGALSGAHASVAGWRSVIVGPHQTLWDIAIYQRPGDAPGSTVRAIVKLNELPAPVVHPGERLLLPPS